MSRTSESSASLCIAQVTIQANDLQDSGIGIVVARRPLTLLVPGHLLELIEQGQASRLLVNGIPYESTSVLPTPALQRDFLSVIQFRKKRQRGLTPANLPRRCPQLGPGQRVLMQKLASESSVAGKIVDIREQGGGTSLITDIGVSIGDSGSPLMVSRKLAAVCQGMAQDEHAVAVPLSPGGLTELRKLRRRYRIGLLSSLTAALLAVSIVFGGFAVYSSNTFSLASIEVSEDGRALVARNAHALTLKPTWSRSFDTPVHQATVFSSQSEGKLDRIAVGTSYEDGTDGAIYLINSNGDILWSYSVPDGDCVYSDSDMTFDGYLVDVIHVADVNEDGSNELLVAFAHNHYYPCKLLVFDLAGEIWAEYWHPGYIRTIATGRVGTAEELLIVVSASNNAIKTDWWNPQTLYAFRGVDIAGQAPPYDGPDKEGREDHLKLGTEIWYQVFVNVDPEIARAKCHEIDIVDFNADGVNEIQAALSDGRFYYLDESGRELHVELGDRFQQLFPDTAAPALVAIRNYPTPAAAGE